MSPIIFARYFSRAIHHYRGLSITGAFELFISRAYYCNPRILLTNVGSCGER